MSDPVSHKDLDDALVNLRADQGVIIARIYEDVRRELKLELKAFKNEMRVLVVGVLVVLGFDLPSEVTAVAILGVAGKGVLARFSS